MGKIVNEHFTVENFVSFMTSFYEPNLYRQNFAYECPVAQFARHVSGYDKVYCGLYTVSVSKDVCEALPEWARDVSREFTYGRKGMTVGDVIDVAKKNVRELAYA